MLLVVAGSMVTRKYLCNVLVMQGLDRRHFRAEFSAAPLKRNVAYPKARKVHISALNSARPH